MRSGIPSDSYALIIGAMKSGTTSLFYYLSQHPQICPAIKKEVEFFSECQPYPAATDSYESLWPFDPRKHLYALEGSTGYTKYPIERNVPENIYRYGINPKFIYVVRDPQERIESHFNHLAKKGYPNQRLADPIFIAFSNYYIQLEQYLNYFSKDRFLILDYKELKRAPGVALLKIYKFLGVQESYLPRTFPRKNTMELQSGLVEWFRRGYWPRTGLDGLPRRIRRLVIPALEKISPPPERPLLTQSERDFVRKSLREDMENFRKKWGFNVSQWGY